MHAALGPVLVIDDDPFARTATAALLEHEGFLVAVAENGTDGISLARLARPAAILLDVIMPGLNGWETLERLKVDPVTRDVPVVIFSGKELVKQAAGAMAHSAQGFVSKPYEPRRLIEILRRYVESAPVRERSA